MGVEAMRRFKLKTWLGAAFLIVALLVRAGAALAQGADPGYRVVPLGYQQITSAAAMSFTIPTGATMAFVTVSGNSVRYRDDGTAPTALLGVTLPVTTAGLPFLYQGTLSKIQFIPTTGSATLDVLYYRQ
jgi:hypothetical protein